MSISSFVYDLMVRVFLKLRVVYCSIQYGQQHDRSIDVDLNVL